MNKDLITNILIIILVLVLGLFLFNRYPSETENNLPNSDTFIPEEIVVHFSYDRGLHEYSGSINFPNGCYSLKASEAFVMESYPEQAVLVLETNPIPEDAVCTQAIKTEDFRILFRASEEATVSARYNGEDIDLLVIQDQMIDDLSAQAEEPEEELETIE